MRCELADHEWVAVSRMLPNKPRGVPQQIAYWVVSRGRAAGQVLRLPSPGPFQNVCEPFAVGFEFQPFVHLLTEDV
jgi:hypothetical protein